MRLQSRYKNVNRTLVSLASGAVVSASQLQSADGGRAFGVSAFDKGTRFGAVKVLWQDVETEKGQYNEAYLAALRDSLKTLEQGNIDAIIVPVTEGLAGADEEHSFEQFIDDMTHTARRIKDCASVLGFAIPDEMAQDEKAVGMFIDALNVKHPQYVYFCGIETQNNRLIPYSLR